MSKTTTVKSEVDMRSLDECIRVASEASVDAQYQFTRAKAPAKKRQHKNGMEIWGSIAFYLNQFHKTVKQSHEQSNRN